MSTSGSYNFSLNRDQMILRALQKINVYGELDTTTTLQADTNRYALCTDIFNGMLKTWSIDGIKVPKRKIGYVFTALSSHEYKLGSVSGSNHCTNSYVSTTLSAAEALGQTVLSVTSTTGMTASDNIGIELDDGSRQWTTIVSVDSSTQVTVTASLTAAAASGNTVVSYTTKINRPITIIYATRLDLNTSTESELGVIGHDEYNKLPNKSLTGTPNNIYYNKVITGTSPYYSSLMVYPEPSNVDTIIKIVYSDAIQDMDGATDNLDLPQEWEYPVIWNLAAEYCYEYGRFQELERIQPKADYLYQLLKSASYDDEPITFRLKVR